MASRWNEEKVIMDDEAKIAIIGYSGSFPGANTPEELWQLTSKGKVGLQKTDDECVKRNLPKEFYEQENFRAVGGGPVDFKAFDAKFFGISPKEAMYLDPQIRKSLETAWNAFEHAGYQPLHIQCIVGAFLASSVNAYFLENLIDEFESSNESERSQILFLNEPDFLATRIAYQFDWTGPAYTIKCGCSSSLVAIHEACQALLNYECDIALSGGVAIKPRYHYGYLYEKDSILSADGKCCPFSDTASGTIFANGVGMVVLKRLSDAINHRDTIHGVIRATAVNNDGKDKVGYMAPSVAGQRKSMQAVLTYSELEPEEISYIETHGTGTEIGDPIEFKGLMEVFQNCSNHTIHLGAVKGNVGHLDAASGVTGLIKVLQEMKHRSISPVVNFNTPNQKMDFNRSPFQINETLSEWKPGPKGRIAIVSSFGIGGTNAQLVIEEWQGFLEPSKDSSEYFFPFSAKTEEQLQERIKDFKRYISKNQNTRLSDISYTLLTGRSHFDHRWHCITKTHEELIQILEKPNKQFIIAKKGSELPLDHALFNDSERLKQLWEEGKNFRPPSEQFGDFKKVPLPLYPFARDEYWIERGIRNRKISDPSRWFYLPYWKRQQIKSCLPILSGKSVLVLCDSCVLSSALVEKLRRLEANVSVVNAGREFFKKENKRYSIRPGNDSDFNLLMRDLESDGKFPDIILHMWNCSEQDLSFEETQVRGLYALVSFCKSSIKIKGTVSSHLAIICNGIANVSGNEVVHPNKSALLGIAQVYPKEYEGAICQLIDIDHTSDVTMNVNGILHELGVNHSSEVAIRRMRRYVKDYAPHQLTDDQLVLHRIADNKNYLIIGGLGNFGMELCEFITENHKANIFLMTRSSFPKSSEWNSWIEEKGLENSISRKIVKIKEMSGKGSSVTVVQGDVSNVEDLRAVRKRIQGEYGPISGVIHAAGVVENGMIANKTVESFGPVFAAKVYGTRNVCEVFLKDNPEFIVLCSSMNSIIGGLGQIDNTAANAFVDAFAEYCVSQGYANVFAINWGAVNEARARNYATSHLFMNLSQEHTKNKMTKEEIFDVYRRLFSTHLGPRVVVSTIDFNEVIKNWNRVASLKELVKAVNLSKKSRKRIVANEFKEPLSEMEKRIARYWQDLLGIDQIGLDDDFFELGGNSLVAIQFIGKLTDELPIKIHAMSIYEYPTLETFATYAEELEREAKEKCEAGSGAS